MKNTDKKPVSRRKETETPELGDLDGMNTASSSEATGMMYCPPRNEDEMRSEEQLFSLQVEMPPEGCVGCECRNSSADSEQPCGKADDARCKPKDARCEPEKN